MSRVFAYCRVSTRNQSAQAQLDAIREAGLFDGTPDCAFMEVASGDAPFVRPALRALLSAIASGDKLVITALNRLGRDRDEVRTFVDYLEAAGIIVIALDVGNVNALFLDGKL